MVLELLKVCHNNKTIYYIMKSIFKEKKMFTLHNPKKNLIKDLKNSKELYTKLVSISKKNGKYKLRAKRQLEYIDDFIEYIEGLDAKEIKDLLKDA